jgi:toxin secretion/phage lysis holin
MLKLYKYVKGGVLMFKSAFLSLVEGIKEAGIEQSFSASLIMLMSYSYGLISTPLFWVLIVFCFIDYMLGVYAAFKNKELDWDLALEGIVKKLYYGVIIVLSVLIDFTLTYLGINTMGIFHNFIMAALLGRELGSITKNADKGGLWVPKMIKEAHKALSKFGKEKM